VGAVSATVRRPRPAPVDVITADQAAELISSAEQRLAELESKRSVADAAADAAERRAGDEPMEPELHTWAKQQLDRLAGELRAEQEVELAAQLEDARARAHECVARARREADVIVSYVRAIHAVRTADGSPPSEGTGASAVETLSEPPPAPPVAASPPDAPALAPPPAPQLADPAPSGGLPAAPPVAPSAPAADATAAPAPSGVPSPGRDEEFWPPSPEPKLRHLLRRAPGLAALQVLAVLVILAVVLLRVG
jgi:hypothetical protein